MGRRGGCAVILSVAGAMAMTGCTLAFPKVDQSHYFSCSKPGDCVKPYVCGSDKRCDLPAEADGGVPDGGSPDGGVSDGGTSDGGIGSCDPRLAVEPGIIDGNLGAALRLYVPQAQGRPNPIVTVAGSQTGMIQMLPTDPDSNSYGFTATVGPGLTAGPAIVKVDFGSGVCFAAPVQVLAPPKTPPPPTTVTVPDGAGVLGGRVTLTVGGLPSDLAPGDPATVWLTATGKPPVEMTAVRVADGATLRATPPLQMAAGPHGVVVIAEDQVWVSKDGALDLAQAPGPSLTGVTPVHLPLNPNATGNDPVTLHLDGTDLVAPGQVWLTCGSGTSGVSGNHAALSQNGPQVTLSVPMPDVTGPEPCVLTYQAPASDGSVVVRFPGLEAYPVGAPPTLQPWTTSPVSLSVPRQDPGAAVATLADGSRDLVVAGGADVNGDPLASTDVVRLGDDGAPTGLAPGTALPAGVIGPAMTAIGPVVYLAGGTTAGGDSQQLLRAQVLGPDDRVTGLDADLDLDGTGYDGGQSGITVFYTVTALYQTGPGTGPLDETPAAVPLRVDVPPGVRADVVLRWQPAPGIPSGYRVYRGATVAGLEALTLGSGGSQTATEYHDDASSQTTVGAHPPQVGGLSAWQVLSPGASLMNTATGPALAFVPQDSMGLGGGPLLVAAGGQQTQSATTTTYTDVIQQATLSAATPSATVGTFGQSTAIGGSGSPVLSPGRSYLDARVLGPGWSPVAYGAALRPTILFGPGTTSNGSNDGGDVWLVGDGTASGMSSLPSALGDSHLFVGATFVDVVGHQPGGGNLVEDLGTLSINGSGSSSTVTVASWTAPTTATLPYTATETASAQAGAFCYVVGGDGPVNGVSVAWTIR